MSAAELVPVALTVLAASVVQGMTGFAFALVAMGILPALIGLRDAIVLLMVLGIAGNLIQLAVLRGGWDRRDLVYLWLGAGVGLPLGVAVQARELPGLARILGLVLATYSLWQWRRRPTPRGPRHAAGGIAAGALGGLLGGALGTSGPPIVIWGQLRQWSPDRARATQVAYFATTGAVQLGLYARGDMVAPAVLTAAGGLLPVLVAGLFGGMWIGRRLDARRFRQVVLVILLVLGVRLVIAG